jgi:hypothetical protein
MIALNVILRIPSIPHEKGFDSFFIHSLANSISLFGEARWWINPLAVFGFYPYSYASAIPFYLSGVSQTTGIDMEITILIVCIILGIFSIFTSYTLAGLIYNDDLFKFLVALGFSISQGILTFTTWEISTRGPFIVLFPLFIFLLLSVRIHKARAMFLIGILFPLLFAIHHYAYLTIPTMAAFVIILILNRFMKLDKNYYNIIYLLSFIIIISIPFLTSFLITTGSKYGWIFELFTINLRYSGPLIFFVFGGFIFLIFRRKKKVEEWFLLTSLLVLSPFFYSQTYAHLFFLIFLFLLIGISLRNVIESCAERRREVMLVIIMSLAFATLFSGFYQHWHTGRSKGIESWHLGEEIYTGGLWLRDYIEPNKRIWGLGDYETYRMFAISGGRAPMIQGEAVALAYGFINESYIKVERISPFSLSFYFDNPYVEVRGRSFSGLISWVSLYYTDIDDPSVRDFIRGLDISYVVAHAKFGYGVSKSIYEKKDNIYDSGLITVWAL